MSFCLILDEISSAVAGDASVGSVNFDFGNLGPQVIQFDATWQPKA